MDGSMNVCMHARRLALWGHTKQIKVISTAKSFIRLRAAMSWRLRITLEMRSVNCRSDQGRHRTNADHFRAFSRVKPGETTPVLRIPQVTEVSRVTQCMQESCF